MSALFLEEAGLNITKKCKYTLRQSRHGCETQQGGEYEIEPPQRTKTNHFTLPFIKCNTLPELKTSQNSIVEVVEKQNIVGNIIISYMKTTSNTEYIFKKL